MNDLSSQQSVQYIDYLSSQGNDSIDLRRVVVTIRKHFWAIAIFTALVTLSVGFYFTQVAPNYRSSVTILFSVKQAQTGFETQGVDENGLSSFIATQIQIIKSRGIAARVVESLALTKHWEYNSALESPESHKSHKTLERLFDMVNVVEEYFNRDSPIVDAASIQNVAVNKLMSQIEVLPIKKTDLVRVNVDSGDRSLAPKIANELVRALRVYYVDQSSFQGREAIEFLEGKASELKLKLDESEKQLLGERRRVGISGDGGDFSGQTIGLLSSRLVDAKRELELAQIEWEQITSVDRSSVQALVTFEEVIKGDKADGGNGSNGGYNYIGTAYEFLPIVDSNSLVQEHKRKAQEARRELEELDNRYGIKHPRVVDAQSSLNTLRRNLDRQIGNVITFIETQYRVSQRQVEAIEADIRREEVRRFDRNASRVSIKELELERDSVRRFYEEALGELRSYQERDLQSVPISVAESAASAGATVNPNIRLKMLIGFVMGGLGTSFLAIFYEHMRGTIQSVGDIEKKIGLPVLGIVPRIRKKLFSLYPYPLMPASFEDNKGGFEEALWAIRANICAIDMDTKMQVIGVTSSVPGEGKSTVAVNLAYAFSGLEKVVLLECDMRRPSIGKALGIHSLGLGDLLLDYCNIEDVILENQIDTVDMVVAGKTVRSAGKLLASQGFSELIDYLKLHYDRILIDLAPIQAVSDTLVVGPYVDSMVYVVKSDATPMNIVSNGIMRIRDKNISVMGVVVSQVDLAKVASYGGDYYYQGYYDYYGYGDNSK